MRGVTRASSTAGIAPAGQGGVSLCWGFSLADCRKSVSGMKISVNTAAESSAQPI
jgi:hypothetical protein